MPIKLNGSTSGYTELSAPATAGNNTLTLPTGNGTADQTLVTNGSGTLSWADRGRLVLSTAQNTTSGTSIDFTGIPSWVKRITVIFNGVSTNGSNAVLVQIGSGSIISTGYNSTGGTFNYVNQTAGSTSSVGFYVFNSSTYLLSGHMILTLVSGTTWVSSHVLFSGNSGSGGGVSPALSGSLDRIRITTVGGTDQFDAGSVNILYEG